MSIPETPGTKPSTSMLDFHGFLLYPSQSSGLRKVVRMSRILPPPPVFLWVACTGLVLAHCDSIGTREGPLPDRPPDRMEQARHWYESALPELQDQRRLDKFSNAEILAAMVAKYPPDWTQSVMLMMEGGVTRITTVLGPEQPSTTHSHDSLLAAIRTISVDVSPSK